MHVGRRICIQDELFSPITSILALFSQSVLQLFIHFTFFIIDLVAFTELPYALVFVDVACLVFIMQKKSKLNSRIRCNEDYSGYLF